MKKSNIVKVLFAVSFFVIAVLLVVGAVVPDDSAFQFGILDAIVYLAGAFSLVCLLASFLLEKKQGTLLASYLFSLVCFGVAIAIGLRWYLAITLMVVYLALLFLVRALFLKGKAWDAGDNQRPDYKDYRQRQAEKEAAEREAAEKNAERDIFPLDEDKKE